MPGYILIPAGNILLEKPGLGIRLPITMGFFSNCKELCPYPYTVPVASHLLHSSTQTELFILQIQAMKFHISG